MSEVMQFQQLTHIEAWDVHQALVKERVRKTLARERMLKDDRRQVERFTETTTFRRWGVGGRMVQCRQEEAEFVIFERREWLA